MLKTLCYCLLAYSAEYLLSYGFCKIQTFPCKMFILITETEQRSTNSLEEKITLKLSVAPHTQNSLIELSFCAL